jgi:Ca-activated chloride channel family protein
MRGLVLDRALPLSLVALFVVACGGAAPATPTPTPAVTPSPSSAATASPTAAATEGATPSGAPATPTLGATPGATATQSPGPVITGPAGLDAPDTVPAATQFQVNWTGPNGLGDFVTIVAKGATEWTDEAYFDTATGTPGLLIAPKDAGDYELWYVNGADKSIATRRPILVTPFVATITGPASVPAGTQFTADWTGPNAPGDYITILAAGTPTWTNENWTYTSYGTPAQLVAPLEAGSYELAYVIREGTVMLRVPITVAPTTSSVSAPASANKSTSISVAWTGPNGPGDYITIVPAGAPEGSYTSYAYTSSGTPATITGPDTAGNYEIRYVYGTTGQTLSSTPIQIK